MILAIILTSILISGFGTIIGFGGGVFMVPILVILFNVKLHAAISAVSFGLLPAAIIASFFNAKAGHIEYKVAIALEIPTIIGAIIGAYLTSILPIFILQLVFSLFLLKISFSFFTKSRSKKNRFVEILNSKGPLISKKESSNKYQISALACTFFGSTSGIIAGLFGIGGGFLKTPIMIKIFNMPTQKAVGTALFMIVFTSLASTVSHYNLGHFDGNIAYPLIAGFSLGAIFGNILKKKITTSNTEKLIGSGLLLASLSMLLNLLSNSI